MLHIKQKCTVDLNCQRISNLADEGEAKHCKNMQEALVVELRDQTSLIYTSKENTMLLLQTYNQAKAA